MIEQLLTELTNALAANTAAQEANTAAIQAVIANSGAATTPAPMPAETPAKEKPKAAAKPKPAPEQTPASELDPDKAKKDASAAADDETKTPDELRKIITDYVRGVLQAAGPKLTEKKAAYEEIRNGYNILKVSELADELLPEFLAKVTAEFV